MRCNFGGMVQTLRATHWAQRSQTPRLSSKSYLSNSCSGALSRNSALAKSQFCVTKGEGPGEWLEERMLSTDLSGHAEKSPYLGRRVWGMKQVRSEFLYILTIVISRLHCRSDTTGFFLNIKMIPFWVNRGKRCQDWSSWYILYVVSSPGITDIA